MKHLTGWKAAKVAAARQSERKAVRAIVRACPVSKIHETIDKLRMK